MTLTVDDRELIDWLRFEGKARSRHKGPNASRHKCEQAADRLQSLLSERDKLRDALQDIAQFEPDEAVETPPYTQIAAFAKHRARAALIQTEVP